ncbi:MAG TPA: hypothetical protein EYP62_00685, partial [Kiritimatiellae bacterium]|nr:hypothetical protein [Kiritimatiellia bacterium]
MQAENRKRVITFVIPFLNEEQNLPVLYERLNQVMSGQPEAVLLSRLSGGRPVGLLWKSDREKGTKGYRMKYLLDTD